MKIIVTIIITLIIVYLMCEYNNIRQQVFNKSSSIIAEKIDLIPLIKKSMAKQELSDCADKQWEKYEVKREYKKEAL